MKRKIMILSIVVIGLLGGGWFGYNEYNRKPKDLLKAKADLSATPAGLLKEFLTNEKEASTKYIDKIIAVKGQVKAIEKSEQGFFTVVLSDTGSMSNVRCTMDDKHLVGISEIEPGATVSVKGVCTGFNADELLGSDVILNRCVVHMQ